MKSISTILLLALAAVASHAADSLVQVRVPAGDAPAPAWAAAQLDFLDAMGEYYHSFLDKFVDGKVDIPPVRQLAVNGGCDDDWAEGVALWDHYLLSRNDPRAQKAYVKFWNVIFQERRMPGANPFWCTGGFDSEHYGELFQLLWGAIELKPTDPKLAADNRRCLDFIIDEFYDPKVRLLKSSYHLRKYKDRHPGDVALNTCWLTAALHAYLATGRKKYKDWAVEYGNSWNQLARAHGGVYPYFVRPGTREITKPWHKPAGWNGFGYDHYGITAPMRSLHSLPVTLCLLDGGDPRHVQPLIAMLKVLFAKGTDGLPAGMHDGEKWYRGERGNWSVPRMLDRAYQLTFDPEVARMIKSYVAAVERRPADDRSVRTERAFLRILSFTYFDVGSPDALAAGYRNGARRRRAQIATLRKAPVPTNGDTIREKYCPYFSGGEYINGYFWGRYDNGRAGSPVAASIRHFTGDGKPGLPRDVAAVVRHVAKDRVILLLHNRAKTPTAMILTAGWYGQHRWGTAAVNDAKPVPVNDRRLKLILAPGATAKLTLAIQRFVNAPTLRPQASD